MIDPKLIARLDAFVAELDQLEQARFDALGYTHGRDFVVWKERSKFVAIDIGTSGAYLVEKDTGELYNIKAYGVPDRNKKAKANLGNIYTCDPATVLKKRWNYLR